MKSFSAPRGNILLWSMMIVGLTLTAVVFLADFVISSLQQSKLSNNALKAYYLAEAGTEQALYQLRHINELGAVNLSANLDGGRLVRSELTENQLNVGRLAKDGVYQLDLVKPESEASLSRLEISGQTASGFLEIQAVGWTLGGVYSQLPLFSDLKGPTDITNGFSESLAGSSGPDYYRRVRLKALYDDVNNLAITGYDAGNNQVSLPARSVVSSQGFYSNSSQKITFSMPRRAPLYGVFDYVIFSEEVLVKE